MTLKTKHYVACEQCGKEFGGPNAGDYDLSEWTSADELYDYLRTEAMGFFWFEITVGSVTVLTCSAKCAGAWAKAFERRPN